MKINKSLKILQDQFTKYFKESDFNATSFINVEMVLYIVRRISPTLDPFNAYVLLRGYQLINHEYKGEDLYLWQQAKHKLFCYSSRMNWEEDFIKYCEPEKSYESIRLYKIVDNKVIKNEGSIPQADREDIYREYLLEKIQTKHSTKVAEAGTYKVNCDGKRFITIKIPEWIAEYGKQNNSLKRSPKQKREIIQLSYEELLQSAEEMKKKVPNDYCYDVLIKNELFGIKDNTNFTINHITNIVGMVGSGKSTLMKVLSFCLAKKGYRIAIVLNTVNEVIKMMSELKKYGLDVSPLIGKTKQEDYSIALKKRGDLFIDEGASYYLNTPCALNGLVSSSDQENSWEYSERPCYNLISCNDSLKNERYRCPLFSICQGTAMMRQAETSSIIITTVAGLSASNIGEERHLFLEEVLSYFDLAIFDECDRVQSTLDNFFAPNMPLNDFINAQADGCAKDMRKTFDDIQLNKNERKFFKYVRATSDAYEGILESLKDIEENEKGGWKELVKSTFSSLTILEQLNKDRLDENLVKSLKDCINYFSYKSSKDLFEDKLNEIIDNIFSVSYKPYENLERLLKENQLQSDGITMRHLILLLKVISFDRLMHKIDDAAKFADMGILQNNDISNFLQKRFITQQKYLPAAPKGNMFGMMYSKSDQKLKVYRQYAYGRMLMLSLPWLLVDEQGEPIGPHTILMSGSSYAPGSLQYNVNVPVDYILKSPEETRKYLEKSEFLTCGATTVVSGSKKTERENNLCKLLSEIKMHIEAECNRDGKILFIVNSYDEATIAWNRMNELLTQWGAKERCVVLIRDGEQKKELTIKKNDIEHFGNHSDKILIAPASVINRGYNIVDKRGNAAIRSVFFLVRPMPVPDDISLKIAKLNGHIAEKFSQASKDNIGIYANNLKNEAGKFWGVLEQDSGKCSLKFLSPESKRDVIATVFITLVQIFGRTARVKDVDTIGDPPRIYFADGAFNKNVSEFSFDILGAIREYLEELFKSNELVAKTLYDAFYQALKEVDNGTEEKIADYGIYSENYYD